MNWESDSIVGELNISYLNQIAENLESFDVKELELLRDTVIVVFNNAIEKKR